MQAPRTVTAKGAKGALGPLYHALLASDWRKNFQCVACRRGATLPALPALTANVAATSPPFNPQRGHCSLVYGSRPQSQKVIPPRLSGLHQPPTLSSANSTRDIEHHPMLPSLPSYLFIEPTRIAASTP